MAATRATGLETVVSAEDAAWLRAFRRDVVEALDGAVEAVLLFGSRARGDASKTSDYDVAVVVTRDAADDASVRRKRLDPAWDRMINGFDIQAIVLDPTMLRPARTELAMRIARDGVSIE